MAKFKSYNGNSNMAFLKISSDDTVQIRSKHSYLLNALCAFIGHWFGIDRETEMFRVCARCGRFEQYDLDSKKWILRSRWQKKHGFKDKQGEG